MIEKPETLILWRKGRNLFNSIYKFDYSFLTNCSMQTYPYTGALSGNTILSFTGFKNATTGFLIIGNYIF
jgi:hypothetical protein